MFKIKNKDPRTTPMARFDKCDNFERSYDTWKILFYGKNSRLKLNYTMNSLNSSQSFKKKLKKILCTDFAEQQRPTLFWMSLYISLSPNLFID